jgi:GTP cyclohydrolase IB
MTISDAALPDLQSTGDTRGVAIHEVGVDRLVYPIDVLERCGRSQRTVAEIELLASLSADIRGTHMSRFLEVLEAFDEQVTPGAVIELADCIRARLGASRSRISFRFPLFVLREAPVSGQPSQLRLECRIEGRSSESRREVTLGVTAPVTSLCPCSKEISDYGAHSQRSRVEVEVELDADRGQVPELWPEELLEVIDTAGSAPIFPLLKRRDERYVTMQAYDNPAFVEDVVRSVAVALRDDPRIERYTVTAVNDESIHDHRAVARAHGENRP